MGYNPNCDIFNRGKIVGRDITLVAKHFEERSLYVDFRISGCACLWAATLKDLDVAESTKCLFT
jgi:hypothetical protein